jgi:hypothetical protein
MTHKRRDLLIAVAALAALVASVEAAAAQTRPPPNAPRSEAEGQSDPRQDPRSTGAVGQSNQTLSDKLSSTGGVIHPPANIAPDLAVRPPEPNPGTTRIIPPPGSPGGRQDIEPK